MTGGMVWFLPIPYLSKVPFGRFRTMSDNMLTYNEFLHKKLKEHKIDYDPANIRDFIDIYLKKVSEVKVSLQLLSSSKLYCTFEFFSQNDDENISLSSMLCSY